MTVDLNRVYDDHQYSNLFGKTTLHMARLVLIGVFALSKGIAGSLEFPYTQRKLGWSNLRIVTLLASWYRAYLRTGVSDPYRS